MKIEISSPALAFFKDEFDIAKTPSIRLFAKYGGNSNIHQGFSVGIMAEEMVDPVVEVPVDQMVFFIEETDFWYFEGYDWHIDYDHQTDSLDFGPVTSTDR